MMLSAESSSAGKATPPKDVLSTCDARWSFCGLIMPGLHNLQKRVCFNIFNLVTGFPIHIMRFHTNVFDMFLGAYSHGLRHSRRSKFIERRFLGQCLADGVAGDFSIYDSIRLCCC